MVEIQSAAKVVLDNIIRVFCHTLDKEHLQEDNITQLNCVEVLVTRLQMLLEETSAVPHSITVRHHWLHFQ